jgi:hypothetical protein
MQIEKNSQLTSPLQFLVLRKKKIKSFSDNAVWVFGIDVIGVMHDRYRENQALMSLF